MNRKADIIETARQLFTTQEYDKTSMQDIMDTLDIAKGTIYHYFESKEALLEAVIEDMIAASITHMQAIVQNRSKTALQKMHALLKAGSIQDENQNLLDTLHKPSNEILHTRLLAATLVKQAPLYAAVIQQGCTEGVFQTDTPLECAEFMLSGMQFLTDTGIYPWTLDDLHRRANAFPHFIEQLLNAPQGSFQFIAEHMKAMLPS